MKLYKKQFTVYVIFIVVLILSGCSNPDSRREAKKLIEKQSKVLKEDINIEKTLQKKHTNVDSLKGQSLKITKNEEAKSNLIKPDTNNGSLDNVDENKKNVSKKENKKIDKRTGSKKDDNSQQENLDTTVLRKKDTIYVDKIKDLAESNDSNKTQTDSISVKETNLKNNSKVQKEELKHLDNEIALKKAQIDSLKEQVEKEAEKIIQKQAKIKESKSAGVSKLTKIITVLIVIALVMFIILYIVGKQGLEKRK